MDEGTLARAIELFFSTKGVGRGTGLGLSMVHGLAARLGGALTPDSRQGEGTFAALCLPVSDSVPATAAVHREPEAVPSATAGTVLLAAERPGLPVLIVSGYAELDGLPADLPRLTKPFRQADLADFIAKLRRDRRFTA